MLQIHPPQTNLVETSPDKSRTITFKRSGPKYIYYIDWGGRGPVETSWDIQPSPGPNVKNKSVMCSFPLKVSVLTSFLLSSSASKLGVALRNVLYLRLPGSLTFLSAFPLNPPFPCYLPAPQPCLGSQTDPALDPWG